MFKIEKDKDQIKVRLPDAFESLILILKTRKKSATFFYTIA